MENNTILVIAAHPDDEVLGCGGTIARYAREGCRCHILFMAEGATARKGDPDAAQKNVLALRKSAQKAAQSLGAVDVEFCRFPDNRMDGVDLLDVVRKVEESLERIKPAIVFSHHHGDLNIDHRMTAQAVETATRPLPGCSVKELYAFEVLSSTEWAFSRAADYFAPDCFTDIGKTIDIKLKALAAYTSEKRCFPHPRSREAVTSLARFRGAQSGLEAAEAFRLVRRIM
ncbi:MAG: putative N-acetyl-alpha-D-glucosaminyl L-malate deacetylase 2 [Syntrophus sp. SKADARSKE-3]|nr:putative N-acetyl-alpha-D-glucosaminyl L-malate deacetylase 2 [Syntrophus sp. SKADARSKE-3]